jgi:hypothetical protein
VWMKPKPNWPGKPCKSTANPKANSRLFSQAIYSLLVAPEPAAPRLRQPKQNHARTID